MEIQKHMSLLLLVCALCVLTSLKFGCGSVMGDHYNRSCIESEKQALLLLKNSFVDNLNSLSSWVGDDCCSWYGIDCNNITGQVTKLNLGVYGLKGIIPESIGALTSLTSLVLSHNKIGGMIPESIGALTSLSWLDLGYNNLQGSIPQSIGNLTSLTDLCLSNNKIGGMIPESIGALTSLTSLVLSGNKIGGMIPESIGALTSLTGLHLSYNEFNRSIPREIGNLTELVSFDISYNKFRGCLPELFPTFLCNVTSLSYIYLSDNNFFGELPQCLGNLIDLQAFDVMNNDLSGNIPISLGYLPLFYLNLHNNKFQGKLPLSFQNLSDIIGLDLGKNNLSGILPRWTRPLATLRYLILRSNNFHGRIPTHLCQHPAIQVLNLARNHFTGNIPLCFANFTTMITTYNYSDIASPYRRTSLGKNDIIIDDAKGHELAFTSTLEFQFSIDLSNNNLSGVIPEELMDLHRLTNLNLAGNHLSGRIPGMIGNLDKLESLDLSGNELYGPIPQSMAYLNFLSRLNLSFNDLSGRIPTGKQLQTLIDPSIYVGNNQLCGGPIPKPCPSDLDSHNFQDYNEADSDDEHMWFYAGIGPGLLVGFLGFCASLHFIKSWRYYYFHYVEQVFEKIAVTIALLLRKFSN